jgi:serine phosphatase RsbU (regulator of sigma subunit)
MAAGFVLGLVLLLQTVFTYRYVAGNLTIQEARRDATRHIGSVERAIRAAGLQSDMLSTVLEDSMDEWKGQVAWIRIIDSDGKVLASAGADAPKDVSKDAAVDSRNPADRTGDPEIRQSSAGRVLVARVPFLALPPRRPDSGQARPPAPANPEQRPRLQFGRGRSIEIAILLDSVSTSFAGLRLYLIVGVSAALSLMAALIFIALRFPQYLRGQQIEGQLELARRVQADLLPSSTAISPNMDFATECISAWEVGGDFCDVFNVPGSRTAIVLGDVSGKGLDAALLMALIQGAIHSSSWTQSTQDHQNASRNLNGLLCRKTARERFASLFWGCFDPKASVVRYINAGHLPPMLLRSEGDSGNLHVERLETGGPVLGLLPEIGYQQGEQIVHKGDLLVAFSDGVIEAPNAAGEEFGEARLMEAIRQSWNSSPNDIRTAILSRLREFMQETPLHDDQTLIVIRFKHSSQQQPQSSAEQTEAVAHVG